MNMSRISQNLRVHRRGILLGLGAGLCAAPSAMAQFVTPSTASPDQFRTSELMGGEFAIRTSQLALERSRDPQIRTFAQLEINEQTAIAAALGTRPGGLPLRPDQAAIVQELASLRPGSRFDHAYVAGQISGHRELLTLNTSYASSGFDNLGRSVATMAVPTIQTHLSILSRLARA